jgi:cell division septum initiation protein DivIVA
MIEEANDRLTSLDERLEGKEAQLRVLIERYINACTSEVSESQRLADSLNAEADDLLKRAEKKAKSLNNSANNVLASRHDGYGQLSDEEVQRMVDGFRSEATRQRLMIEAEAKMMRERAQRLIDAIDENKATALVTLKYNGGALAVETANIEIKNGGV